ncbi:helix-turn-helix transcriptional regulator [Bacillus sp. AK031]
MKKNNSKREDILTFLKREASLSVNELTERINITHMGVRKHLTALENDGLVTSHSVKQEVGRPLQVYSLTSKGEDYFPRNYEGITVEFIKDIQELHGQESVNYLFTKREDRLTKEYTERMLNKNPEERMKEIYHIQNEKGYMADVSKIDDKTYELTENNCPIYAVANEFKMACTCETSMLKNVLKTKQVSRTNCRTDGDNHCKFLIKFNE